MKQNKYIKRSIEKQIDRTDTNRKTNWHKYTEKNIRFIRQGNNSSVTRRKFQGKKSKSNYRRRRRTGLVHPRAESCHHHAPLSTSTRRPTHPWQQGCRVRSLGLDRRSGLSDKMNGGTFFMRSTDSRNLKHLLHWKSAIEVNSELEITGLRASFFGGTSGRGTVGVIDVRGERLSVRRVITLALGCGGAGCVVPKSWSHFRPTSAILLLVRWSCRTYIADGSPHSPTHYF